MFALSAVDGVPASATIPPMWKEPTRCTLAPVICLSLAAGALTSCRRDISAIPPGITKELTAEQFVEAAVRSVDPAAVIMPRRSGGGEKGPGAVLGRPMRASFAYMYTGEIRSTARLHDLVVALRTKLRDTILARGGTIRRDREHAKTTREGPKGPQEVLRTADGMGFSREGYEGDVFLCAYPVTEPRTDYIVVIRAVEVLVSQ